jgi:hypothetical protein
MVRGSVLLAIVALLIGGLSGGPAVPDDSAFTATGDVHILTAPDGMTTAVTVDVGGQSLLPDGVVDHAFRLQHKSSKTLEYDGPATISYIKGRLTIRPDDGEPWAFRVATVADISAPAIASTDAAIVVMGLSHHWGKAIHRSSVDVTVSLLSAGCSLDGGDKTCEKCEAGGPGAEGCDVECEGGSGCSVSCGAGSMACCTCGVGCRCCPRPNVDTANGGVR